MSTILFHASENPAQPKRLEDALALARATRAHLTALHLTPAEAYVAFDAFGGVFVTANVIDAVVEGEQRLRARVEQALDHEDVPWDYIQANGNFATGIAAYGALADLIVTGRLTDRREGSGEPAGLLGDLIWSSRTPVFVCGDGERVHDPFAPAVIGWNGSFEAANAVRGALPYLRLARSVHVVAMEEEREGKGEALFPSTRLLEYLSRHAVHADLETVPHSSDGVVPTLIGRIERTGASTLVTGGYGRSRIGEYLFGGVTRSLLQSCPVGWIVAH